MVARNHQPIRSWVMITAVNTEVNTPISQVSWDKFQFFLALNTLSPLFLARRFPYPAPSR